MSDEEEEKAEGRVQRCDAGGKLVRGTDAIAKSTEACYCLLACVSWRGRSLLLLGGIWRPRHGRCLTEEGDSAASRCGTTFRTNARLGVRRRLYIPLRPNVAFNMTRAVSLSFALFLSMVLPRFSPSEKKRFVLSA